jgi:Reverse transcriptase (RNA-dependent DNA polymerase)
VNGFLSNSQCINRIIVQGSGIRPFLYNLMESDLHTPSQINEILKYADDTNLLVLQHTDISMDAEYQNVMHWASRNKLTINSSKTKEIVFRRPHFRSFDIQPSFTDTVMFDGSITTWCCLH